MKRMAMATLALLAGTMVGCKDMGLDGNIPLSEAESRPPAELVAMTMQPTAPTAAPLVVDGRLWVHSGLPFAMDPADVRAIGSAAGTTVYARTWDRSPYDALFVRQDSADAAAGLGRHIGGQRWLELKPVTGRSGPVPGSAQGSEAGTAAPAPQH